MIRQSLLYLAIFLVLSEFAYTQHDGTRGPILPEPMVFDLVRPLGAKKGELEFNTLAIFPLRRKEKLQIDWAPEIEWAFADGYAIELELPMMNGHIEAYKVAIQGTFPIPKSNSFIHGWQWISEYIREEQLMESTLLYLAGKELSSGYSIFGMLGSRHNAFVNGSEIRPRSIWNMLFNASFNRRVNKTTIISLEANYAYHFGLGQELRLIPQIQYRVNDFINIQGGFGYEWFMGDRQPIFATRVITEF